MKVSPLIVLSTIAVLWLGRVEANPPTLLVCDNEAAVKISHLFGLRHHLLRKQENVPMLMKDIQKAQSALDDLHELLNSTLKGTEGLEREIENISTPEINKLELSQTCDGTIPKDCCQIKQMFPSAKSGLYAIRDPCLIGDKLFSTSRLTVYCDMETDGGGWIVIQRRNASIGWVNFTSNWADYEKGFGDLDGEYWIGLKNIYELTNQQQVSLKASAWNETGRISWNYSNFRISDASNRYSLSVASGGKGNASYSLFSSGGDISYYFGTYDQSSNSCGLKRKNGWWFYPTYSYNRYSNPRYTFSYSNCAENANLNGLHQPSGIPGTDATGERLMWRTGTSTYTNYLYSEMKIRPQSCSLN